jgi:hypothetical protein
MTGWLDPVRRALDSRPSPVTMFVRDDDGGWNDDALRELLELTGRRGVPVAVAMIPDATAAALARALRAADAHLVAVHQHGRAHVNHEPIGRKCEFGPSRSIDRQHADIAGGRMRLLDLFADRLEPIFTPPWNRCTAATAACLAELGFALLSRDASAAPFDGEPIPELPVSLDWTGKRGARGGAAAWGDAIAHRIAQASRPVGLMLHHAVMSASDFCLLGELLDVLTAHPAVDLRPMRAAATGAPGEV